MRRLHQKVVAMLVKLNSLVADVVGHDLHRHLVSMALEEFNLREWQVQTASKVRIPGSLVKERVSSDRAIVLQLKDVLTIHI